jgi:hypothetical protein
VLQLRRREQALRQGDLQCQHLPLPVIPEQMTLAPVWAAALPARQVCLHVLASAEDGDLAGSGVLCFVAPAHLRGSRPRLRNSTLRINSLLAQCVHDARRRASSRVARYPSVQHSRRLAPPPVALGGARGIGSRFRASEVEEPFPAAPRHRAHARRRPALVARCLQYLYASKRSQRSTRMHQASHEKQLV